MGRRAARWSHERAGGSFNGDILGVYSHRVAVDGNAPVGDLFEQLTIAFVGGMANPRACAGALCSSGAFSRDGA